ncbi:uncharacterized protein METZ01_LOCUS122152, partial [marine metagenome]
MILTGQRLVNGLDAVADSEPATK